MLQCKPRPTAGVGRFLFVSFPTDGSVYVLAQEEARPSASEQARVVRVGENCGRPTIQLNSLPIGGDVLTVILSVPEAVKIIDALGHFLAVHRIDPDAIRKAAK